MNSVKCYNSFVGFMPRIFWYVLHPIFIASFTYFQLGFLRSEWMLKGCFCLVMPISMFILFCFDRWAIGPIFLNKGQDDELIKSSPRGGLFLRKVFAVDIIFRFILYVALTLIQVLMTVISGFYGSYKTSIIASAILFLISLDAISNLMLIVARSLEGTTSAILAIYGLEILFAPAIISIIVGKVYLMLIFAILYLFVDVLVIVCNIKKTKKLVEEIWYTD